MYNSETFAVLLIIGREYTLRWINPVLCILGTSKDK